MHNISSCESSYRYPGQYTLHNFTNQPPDKDRFEVRKSYCLIFKHTCFMFGGTGLAKWVRWECPWALETTSVLPAHHPTNPCVLLRVYETGANYHELGRHWLLGCSQDWTERGRLWAERHWCYSTPDRKVEYRWTARFMRVTAIDQA